MIARLRGELTLAPTVLGPVGGFGKFLLVLLAFSTVAANVPNTCKLS